MNVVINSVEVILPATVRLLPIFTSLLTVKSVSICTLSLNSDEPLTVRLLPMLVSPSTVKSLVIRTSPSNVDEPDASTEPDKTVGPMLVNVDEPLTVNDPVILAVPIISVVLNLVPPSTVKLLSICKSASIFAEPVTIKSPLTVVDAPTTNPLFGEITA